MRDRAAKCISQGCLTNSKHETTHLVGLYPTHIKTAHGSHIWDTNDRRYLDYICGLGTNLLGYGNDFINKQIMKVMYQGYSHSLPTVHEVYAAEALKELFPFVDQFKFLKSGSEACTAAVKIARAMTGRKVILTEGYHGWHDVFTHLVPPGHGTEHCLSTTFEKIDDIDSDTAAVVVEPVICDDSEKRIDYLKALRKRCDEVGALLIFDEVITGFRYKKFGVSNNYGILPDLIVLGKAIANGMPLAAVGGKSHLMSDRKWFVSSTYAGEILSLTASTEVCRLLLHDSRYDLNHLIYKGYEFTNKFNELPINVKISSYGTRGIFTGPDEGVALFFQEMAKCDILFGKSWFYNFDHIKQNDIVLDLAKDVALKMMDKKVKLEYPLPQSPFAAKVRKL